MNAKRLPVKLHQILVSKYDQKNILGLTGFDFFSETILENTESLLQGGSVNRSGADSKRCH